MLFLCLKIFFVRIIDVSLGTIRTIMSVKNKNFVASVIGFIEVTVWFLVVKEALNTANNSFFIVFSYAFGFSTGTYIGGILSSHYIKSSISVQIITRFHDLINILRSNGFGVSVINVNGKESDSFLLLIHINSNNFELLKSIVNKYDERAFIVISETKYVQNGFIKK